MKTYRYLIALFATLICISFTACSDDSDDGDYDDGPSTSASIVGTWIYDSRGEYRVYTFYSNGTGESTRSTATERASKANHPTAGTTLKLGTSLTPTTKPTAPLLSLTTTANARSATTWK